MLCVSQGSNDNATAEGTQQYEDIDCSLVLRSIGYKSHQIDPDVPFDWRRGLIPNSEGRVLDTSGNQIPGRTVCVGVCVLKKYTYVYTCNIYHAHLRLC